MFYFSDMIDGYIEFWNDVSGVIIYITIIIPVYYLPYAFIRLSCPQVALLPKYRIYKTVLTSQLIVYLILLIYVNSPFPAVLSEYIDQKYLHWIHR